MGFHNFIKDNMKGQLCISINDNDKNTKEIIADISLILEYKFMTKSNFGLCQYRRKDMGWWATYLGND